MAKYRMFHEGNDTFIEYGEGDGTTPVPELEWRELAAGHKNAKDKREAVLKKASEAGRELTNAEAELVAHLDSLMRRFDCEMDLRTERGNRDPQQRRSGREVADPDQHSQNELRSAAAKGLAFRDIETGRIVRAVTHKESLRAVCPNIRLPRASFGDAVASLARGRPITPEIEEEFRVMSIGTPSAGGYAVPSPYSLQFIDLARAASVVMQAGAVTLPMSGNTLTLAKITDDPTVSWKSENAAFSPSDATLGSLVLTARVVGCLIKVSEELVQDSPNISEILETAISNAMALEMDRVALVGSGVAPEPQGIYGGTDVQTESLGGTPTNYDFFSRMVQKVRTANHEPNAAIWHPRDLGTLDRLKDTTGQPMMPPKSFSGMQHYSTTSIPTNIETGASPNDGSIAIVGKWNELIIAPRLEMFLAFSRESNDGTDSAFAKYQIHIRAVARMAVGLGRGAAFCVGTVIDN